MDGVLVDSEPISCRVAADCLNEIGYETDARTICDRFLGVRADTMLAAVTKEMGRPLPEGLRERIRAMTLAAYEGQLAAVPGMTALVDALEHPRCVASSSHPERIHRSLELTGMLHLLEPHLFSSSMVERGKPAPDLFLHAASEMGAPPERCTVVEDSVAGVEAGHAAGMRVVGFTAGGHVDHADHAPRLVRAGAHAIARNAEELRVLLEEERG